MTTRKPPSDAGKSTSVKKSQDYSELQTQLHRGSGVKSIVGAPAVQPTNSSQPPPTPKGAPRDPNKGE